MSPSTSCGSCRFQQKYISDLTPLKNIYEGKFHNCSTESLQKETRRLCFSWLRLLYRYLSSGFVTQVAAGFRVITLNRLQPNISFCDVKARSTRIGLTFCSSEWLWTRWGRSQRYTTDPPHPTGRVPGSDIVAKTSNDSVWCVTWWVYLEVRVKEIF